MLTGKAQLLITLAVPIASWRLSMLGTGASGDPAFSEGTGAEMDRDAMRMATEARVEKCIVKSVWEKFS